MDLGGVRGVVTMSRPVDGLMVAILVLLAWFEIWIEPIFQTGMPGPRLPLTLLVTVALVPLLARRVFPLAALVVMCTGIVAVGVVGDPHQSTFVLVLGLLVGVYSLGAYATPRNALVGIAVTAGAAAVFEFSTFVDKTPADVAVPILLLAGAWVAGKQVQRQRQRAGELEQRTELLARTRQLEVDAAVAAERTRIARELHDVVAHAISVMGIQAGAARRTLAPEQTAQCEALLDVERLGREALVEMQRMLQVLRPGDGDQGADPVPDLSQVPVLAETARSTGVEVDLDTAGEPERLPAGLQLTAYRIVQEALTNVRKHARADGVRIRVVYRGGHLEVTVTDDGVGSSAEPVLGNGLIGMRERVALHRGTLYAGPDGDSGFVVRARLPVQADA